MQYSTDDYGNFSREFSEASPCPVQMQICSAGLAQKRSVEFLRSLQPGRVRQILSRHVFLLIFVLWTCIMKLNINLSLPCHWLHFWRLETQLWTIEGYICFWIQVIYTWSGCKSGWALQPFVSRIESQIRFKFLPACRCSATAWSGQPRHSKGARSHVERKGCKKYILQIFLHINWPSTS